MADELFDELKLAGPAPMKSAKPKAAPASKATYRVLDPGDWSAARARSPQSSQSGARVEPTAPGKYPMRPGPAPRQAMPPPLPGPEAPKYDPATYDGVAEYAKLRAKLGFPSEATAPMPVYRHAPAEGLVETFMPQAQEAAALATAARGAPSAFSSGVGAVNRGVGRLGQHVMDGGLRPATGGLAGMAGAAALTAGAGAINRPEAALRAVAHPLDTAYGLGRGAYDAVVHPHESWGPDFATGMTRLLQGDVGGDELAGAVGDATGIGPMFRAGLQAGETMRQGFTDPAQAGANFRRGLGVVGRALGGDTGYDARVADAAARAHQALNRGPLFGPGS